MSTAVEIMMTARNASEAETRAESENPNITQDWTADATLYRFNDGSVLAISGAQLNAYADETEAMSELSYPFE